MKPSELPGARRLYRLTNRALAPIRELWQYAGERMSFLRTLSSTCPTVTRVRQAIEACSDVGMIRVTNLPFDIKPHPYYAFLPSG